MVLAACCSVSGFVQYESERAMVVNETNRPHVIQALRQLAIALDLSQTHEVNAMAHQQVRQFEQTIQDSEPGQRVAGLQRRLSETRHTLADAKARHAAATEQHVAAMGDFSPGAEQKLTEARQTIVDMNGQIELIELEVRTMEQHIASATEVIEERRVHGMDVVRNALMRDGDAAVGPAIDNLVALFSDPSVIANLNQLLLGQGLLIACGHDTTAMKFNLQTIGIADCYTRQRRKTHMAIRA